MGKQLTPKQKKFCEEYLIDLNGKQAAIRAGYSKNSAEAIASENLRKPYVAAYLSERQKDLSKRTGVTQEDVIDEIKKVAFSRMDGIVKNITGQTVLSKPWEDIDENTLAAIKEIHNTRDGIKIKLHDKLTALDKLCRHLGLFEKDNEQQRPVIDGIKVEVVR